MGVGNEACHRPSREGSEGAIISPHVHLNIEAKSLSVVTPGDELQLEA